MPSNCCGIGVGLIRSVDYQNPGIAPLPPPGMCELNTRQRRYFYLEEKNSLLPYGASMAGYPSGKKYSVTFCQST